MNCRLHVLVCTLILSIFSTLSAFADVAKPPQFVLMAFDGSKNINIWQRTRNFSKEMQAQNVTVKFTYFISGVYFLGNGTKSLYQAPRRSAGRSDIGFGVDNNDISLRVDELNLAVTEGHEMGSHANGHFDGSNWTQAEWDSENDQFSDLIFKVFTNNNLEHSRLFPQGLVFEEHDIRGFRAPLLGVSDGLWPSLQSHNFTYDTSKTSRPTYWPEKSGYGVWNFPLANLTIAGTGKRTLSMDYNFYVAQSQGQPDAANSELYRSQMLQTYRNYFNTNYNGNRAPVHIGHHFSMWNGAAYWNAMKDFAREVCGQPEVRCVTYSEYEQWLESLPAATLESYRNAAVPTPMGFMNTNLSAQLNLQNATITARVSNPDLMRSQNLSARWRMGRRVLAMGMSLPITQNRLLVATGKFPITFELINRRGESYFTATHMLDRRSDGPMSLSPQSIEDQALLGDLPAAHNED